MSGNSSGLEEQDEEKFRKRFFDQQTNLHLKHYEVEQLVALLDFYATDIGKSILESQERVSDEIVSGMQLISGEITEEIKERHLQKHQARIQAAKKPFSDDNT